MRSPVSLIPELANHLVGAGGKRMRPLLTVAAANAIRKQPGRREYLRGTVVAVDGCWQVKTAGNQGSGVLRSMSEANCFVVLPEACAGVQPGDQVAVELFEGLF